MRIAVVLLSFVLTGAAATAASPAYPLKSSPNHRYLVDRNGTPFLIHGDAPWSLISGLTKAEAEVYLRDRARKGFNTLMVNLIEHKFHGPKNREGESPFTRAGDFSTPNEEYFRHADWVIHKAGEYGIQILLAPCYLGYAGSDEGWYEEVRATSVEKCRNYGRFVAARYKNFDNILWLLGGDRDPGDVIEQVREMALAIKETDGRHLMTAHCAPEHSARNVYPQEQWLDVNSTYTYKIVHAMVLSDYNAKPVMPFFLIESTYENEHNSTTQWIRRQAYWALLNGAAGQLMGNRPIWLFDPGWETALDGPASVSMMQLKALFASRPWYELIPDQEHRVVNAGWGDAAALDYLGAALTKDAGTLIVYLPSSRPIAVDLSRLSGKTVKGWWFDPRTGESSSAGEFSTSGQREFSPPETGDWVFVLDDASKRLLVPGKSRTDK